MRKQILAIVKQDTLLRQSLLKVVINDLSSKGAPFQMIEALSCLKKDEVAKETLKLLSQSSPFPSVHS